MWNDSVVTDGGMTILSQWAGGGSTLDITAAKLGGSTVPAVQLVRQTNVTGFKGTADIIQHKDIDGGVQFTIRISPLGTAAVIKQIGIFGKLNGGEEKLIAIYQDNDGIPVPGSEMPEFAYDFNATIAADRGSDINVNVDPMAFATKVELDENVAAINEKIDEVLPKTMMSKGFIDQGTNLDEYYGMEYNGCYYIGNTKGVLGVPTNIGNVSASLVVINGSLDADRTTQLIIGGGTIYHRLWRGSWLDWYELVSNYMSSTQIGNLFLYKIGKIVWARCITWTNVNTLKTYTIPSEYCPINIVDIPFTARVQTDTYGKFVEITTEGSFSATTITGDVLFNTMWFTK